MTTNVAGNDIVFLLNNGKPDVVVHVLPNTINHKVVTGKNATELALSLLPVNCWPAFATALVTEIFNKTEDSYEQPLFDLTTEKE